MWRADGIKGKKQAGSRKGSPRMRRSDLRSCAGLLLGECVLNPREGDHEQRREHEAQEDVDPGERHVVGGHAQRGPDGSEYSVMFHDDLSDEVQGGCGRPWTRRRTLRA